LRIHNRWASSSLEFGRLPMGERDRGQPDEYLWFLLEGRWIETASMQADPALPLEWGNGAPSPSPSPCAEPEQPK
jgi:hypothetical protein